MIPIDIQGLVPDRAIWIPNNVPSLKNSKQIVRIGKHPRLIPSKAHSKYEKDTFLSWQDGKEPFKAMLQGEVLPVRVNYYIIRQSKHRWDWTNTIDTIQDLMVKHEWIEDDNASIMYPFPVGWHWDKDNPGAYIWI